MTTRILPVADNFWNIRGSFKIGGVIEIGTHASLVRRGNGKFVLLDAYTLDDDARREVDALTSGGTEIEAILNLHPFHTVHVQGMHAQYPQATLYGTARHKARFPDLPWAKACTEEPRLHALFADDLEFSVPRGVDFIASNENLHFSSVLALHRGSGTIHVDDTYMYVPLPKPMRLLGMTDSFSFHPTLKQVLERRAGAVRDFRAWAEELNERWGDAENLCAAHTGALTAEKNRGAPIRERMANALRKVGKTLAAHERKYG